jgi:hypothetical protein
MHNWMSLMPIASTLELPSSFTVRSVIGFSNRKSVWIGEMCMLAPVSIQKGHISKLTMGWLCREGGRTSETVIAEGEPLAPDQSTVVCSSSSIVIHCYGQNQVRSYPGVLRSFPSKLWHTPTFTSTIWLY